MSHEPEPGQTNAARPFNIIERPHGRVSISRPGNERFRHDSEVEGYDNAKALAHGLAVRFGVGVGFLMP